MNAVSSSRAIRAARAFVEISGEDSKLRQTLSGATGLLKSTAATAARIGTNIAQFAAGTLLAGGIRNATAALFDFSNQGDAIHKMAGRTGASTEALSQLAHAAGLSGTSIETVEKGMRKLNELTVDAASGSKSAAAALRSVGLSADQLQGLAPDEQLRAVAEALSRVTDTGQRAALAADLLGKSGAEMLPMMEGGAEGIRDMMAEADKLGLTMSGEQAEAAAKFNDAWSRTTAAAGAAGRMIGTALAPAMAWLFNRVASAIPVVIKLAQTIGTGIVNAASSAWHSISFLTEKFQPLIELVSETFGGIIDALSSGDIALAGRIYWLYLKTAWVEGIDALNQEWLLWKKAFQDTFDQAVTYVLRKWHQLQNMLSGIVLKVMSYFDSSVDVEGASAELDAMLQRQLKSVEQRAQANQAARDSQFEADISRVNKDLEAARAEWAAAVAQARTLAEAAANEPSAADTATSKFDELIRTLQAGDIATRIDEAVRTTGTGQDLRTMSGQSQILDMVNGPGGVSQAQLRTLQAVRQEIVKLVTITERGPKAVHV